MDEMTLEGRVPTGLLKFGFDEGEIQRHVTKWLVLTLFTEGHISSGKAARLLDITRIEFLALLRRRGIVYVDYSPEELAEEFEVVEALKTGSPNDVCLQHHPAHWACFYSAV